MSVEVKEWLAPIAAILAAGAAGFSAWLVAKLSSKVVTEVAAQDLVWRHREETMRQLRWATELMLSDDVKRAYAGASALDSLMESQLLQEVDTSLVQAMTVVAGDISEWYEEGSQS
jgi:hypothetical protein